MTWIVLGLLVAAGLMMVVPAPWNAVGVLGLLFATLWHIAALLEGIARRLAELVPSPQGDGDPQLSRRRGKAKVADRKRFRFHRQA